MIEINNNCNLIICLLIIASIIILIVFLNWYVNCQTNKKVVRQWVDQVEKCKIDRYEKKYRGLERWEIKDRLNNGNQIVMVRDLPDDIAEEIMDYSLKLIEENTKWKLKN